MGTQWQVRSVKGWLDGTEITSFPLYRAESH